MASKILTCTCKHEFQDKVHGPQKRVHNQTAKTSGAATKEFPLYRCTVCGTERTPK